MRCGIYKFGKRTKTRWNAVWSQPATWDEASCAMIAGKIFAVTMSHTAPPTITIPSNKPTTPPKALKTSPMMGM